MGPAPFAHRSAFTLIETLLTLAVIGLIAALIVPAMASLRWEAAADRAQAEVVAALSDARSLSRSRSSPVLVTLRRAPDGAFELWGAVLDASNLGPLPGDKDEGTDSPPVKAGRRLGILPERCTLGAAKAADGSESSPATGTRGSTTETAPTTSSTSANGAAGAGSELPEPLQLAVIFPDGTALVPRARIVLTIPQGPGKADLSFALAINPWFAEAQFTVILPSKSGETGADAVPEASPGQPTTREAGSEGAVSPSGTSSKEQGVPR